MKLSKILIGAILLFSIVNANWDRELKNIKSNSKIYNKGIEKIIKTEKEINNSTGKIATDMSKYLAVDVIPNLFLDLIKANDVEGFSDMLKASEILSVRIDNLHEVSNVNIGIDIVDNNAIDILKLLLKDNIYNFDTSYLLLKDNGELIDITTKQYAKEKNADEIVKILEQNGY